MRVGLFLCTLILLVPFFLAWRSDSPVEIIQVPGQAVQLKMKEGRVATLFLDRLPRILFNVHFEVSENTCSNFDRPKCSLASAYGVDNLALNWVTHPDPQKIGKTVTARLLSDPNATDMPLSSKTEVYGSFKHYFEKLGADVPNEEIVCDDYRWLPGGSGRLPPKNLLVARWDNELMLPNPETLSNENRIFSGSLDVQMEANTHGTLSITSVRNYTGFIPLAFVGDILGWVVALENGEYCQISLKPNLAGLQEQGNEYIKHHVVDFKPYIYGSDESLQLNNAAAFIAHPELYEIK